jgi:hypothetical protein
LASQALQMACSSSGLKNFFTDEASSDVTLIVAMPATP